MVRSRSSGVQAVNTDGVDLGQSNSLGQSGGGRLSGGALSESKGRQNGEDELGELHFDSKD